MESYVFNVGTPAVWPPSQPPITVFLRNKRLSMQEKFDSNFVPSVIAYISQSDDLWDDPGGKVLQKIHETF